MHLETLTSVNDLGWLLKDIGKLADAEPLLRGALAGRKEVGATHRPRSPP